jgi:low affinity Fe/Cu permease
MPSNRGRFTQPARRLTQWTGSPYAALLVGTAVALWLLIGFVVDFSRSWELCVTVGLPILSLGVLIVIQHTQTHDDRAMQLKLDELIRAIDGASTRLMGAEDEDWDDLNDLRQRSRDGLLKSTNRRNEPGRDGSPDGSDVEQIR